jgi:hypothetical protein
MEHTAKQASSRARCQAAAATAASRAGFSRSQPGGYMFETLSSAFT